MEITDIRIRKLNTNSADPNQMRAIVSVTLDDEFVVHDIKVIKAKKKCFIAMPSRRLVEDGTYKDITHPINHSFRHKIEQAVLDKYREALEKAAARAEAVAKQATEAGSQATEGDGVAEKAE